MFLVCKEIFCIILQHGEKCTVISTPHPGIFTGNQRFVFVAPNLNMMSCHWNKSSFLITFYPLGKVFPQLKVISSPHFFWVILLLRFSLSYWCACRFSSPLQELLIISTVGTSHHLHCRNLSSSPLQEPLIISTSLSSTAFTLFLSTNCICLNLKSSSIAVPVWNISNTLLKLQ